MSRTKINFLASLNEKVSSFTVVDPFAYQRRPLWQALEARVQSAHSFLQIKNSFKAFRKEQMRDVVIDNYKALNAALQRRDKAEVARLCSVPLFELLDNHLESKTLLPFSLHRSFEGADLLQARTFKKELGASANSTWF